MAIDSVKIAVTAEALTLQSNAHKLAKRLGLSVTGVNFQDYDFLLTITEKRLELREVTQQKSKPLYIDFLAGALRHRRKYGGGRSQLIARAVGVKRGEKLSVLDATAGLGHDAFALACLGCRVHMLERSPVIAVLLEDALKRAVQSEDFAAIEIKLTVTDAISHMQTISPRMRPDVVYLDPMYPKRTKSALVKKEMRILRTIVGDDPDTSELLATALKTAKKRVVVKRPKIAPEIKGPKPDLVFKSKSSRFDVYFSWYARRKITTT